MKKFMVIVLVCICIFGNVGCSRQSQQVKGNQILKKGNIINIEVSSLPKGYDYSFSGEDAKAITDYLSTLNLASDFEDSPDKYDGMTWVISLKYEDGDTLNIYHFGNRFIRSEKSSWYKISYEEASRFDTLLTELNN